MSTQTASTSKDANIAKYLIDDKNKVMDKSNSDDADVQDNVATAIK